MSVRSRLTSGMKRLLNIVEHPGLIYTIGQDIDREIMRDLFFVNESLRVQPKTLIDVGASVGNWSKAAMSVFPSASVIAFEPLPEIFPGLCRRFEGRKNFRALNLALGSTNDECVFYQNKFSYSSSYLKATDNLKVSFPHAGEVQEIRVQRRRLDSLTDIVIEPPSFVKVDVQGAEMEVLEGFGKQLAVISCVQLELNFAPLYENQSTPDATIRFLREHGFDNFIQTHPHFAGTGSPSLLCSDMIFFRSSGMTA